MGEAQAYKLKSSVWKPARFNDGSEALRWILGNERAKSSIEAKIWGKNTQKRGGMRCICVISTTNHSTDVIITGVSSICMCVCVCVCVCACVRSNGEETSLNLLQQPVSRSVRLSRKASRSAAAGLSCAGDLDPLSSAVEAKTLLISNFQVLNCHLLQSDLLWRQYIRNMCESANSCMLSAGTDALPAFPEQSEASPEGKAVAPLASSSDSRPSVSSWPWDSCCVPY